MSFDVCDNSNCGSIFLFAILFSMFFTVILLKINKLLFYPIQNGVKFAIWGKDASGIITNTYTINNNGDEEGGSERDDAFINYKFIDPDNNNIYHIQNESFHDLNYFHKNIENKKGKEVFIKYYYGFSNQLRIHSQFGMKIYCDATLICYSIMFIGCISIGIGGTYLFKTKISQLFTFFMAFIVFPLLQYIFWGKIMSHLCGCYDHKYDYRLLLDNETNPKCICDAPMIEIGANKLVKNAPCDPNILLQCECCDREYDDIYCNKCNKSFDSNEGVYHCYVVNEEIHANQYTVCFPKCE
eukprot:29226_1